KHLTYNLTRITFGSMATSKAVIRRNKINSKGECLVYIRYVHKEKSVDFSTGIKIKPASWNEKKETINSAKLINRNKQNEDVYKALLKSDNIANSQIALKREEILSIARELQLQNIQPAASLVKEKHLKKESKVKVTDQREDELVIDLFSEFINESSLSYGTLKGYKTCLYHLSSFEERISKRIRVRDINISLINDFVSFLNKDIKKQGGEIGLQDSSVGASKKNLKVFLKHLKKKGYLLDINLEDVKVAKASTPIHFLTEDEVDQLLTFDFSGNDRLGRVRDLFVFNCFTGLRYSDLSRLTRNHIQDDSIILRTYKNQTDVFIPLTTVPRQILEAYDYNLPAISDQKFNDYIKEVGRAASIDSQVEVIKTKSGNKQYEYAPKWQVLSSHIAIKTFITMCGSKGVSPKVVSEVTGKSVNIIMKHYYGTSKKSIRSEMARAFG
ncbi:MAG: phage integrase SAM-like domain-containing protein, partial [Cyclobacteriaceae bacterium]